MTIVGGARQPIVAPNYAYGDNGGWYGGGGGGVYDDGDTFVTPGGGDGGYASKTYAAGQLSVGSTVTVIVGRWGVGGLCYRVPPNQLSCPLNDGIGGFGGIGRVYIQWN